MRLLYTEDNNDVRTTVKMLIELKFPGCEIVEAISGNSAIEILSKDSNFDIILADYNMPNGTGGDLYTFMISNGLNIPFILLSSEQVVRLPEFKTFYEDHSGNAQLLKPATSAEIEGAINHALNSNTFHDKVVQNPNNIVLQQPRAIKLDEIKRFNTAPCDIFLKLSEQKFVKILHRGTKNTADIYNKYAKRNVDEFYIHENDYSKLTDSLTDILYRTLDSKDSETYEKTTENLLDSHEAIQKNFINFGICENTVKLAKKTIDETLLFFNSVPDLSKIIDPIRNQKGYIFGHSLLTSYMATIISSESEWNSRSTRTKLTMASLLHDISLENDENAKIQDIQNLKEYEFSKDIEKKIQHHPIEGAKIVGSFKDLPPNIDTIVLQHHERPDGSGYPRKLNSKKIAPLSCIFIMAHDMAARIYERGLNEEVSKKILEDFENFYNKGNFLPHLSAVTKILKK